MYSLLLSHSFSFPLPLTFFSSLSLILFSSLSPFFFSSLFWKSSGRTEQNRILTSTVQGGHFVCSPDPCIFLSSWGSLSKVLRYFELDVVERKSQERDKYILLFARSKNQYMNHSIENNYTKGMSIKIWREWDRKWMNVWVDEFIHSFTNHLYSSLVSNRKQLLPFDDDRYFEFQSRYQVRRSFGICEKMRMKRKV